MLSGGLAGFIINSPVHCSGVSVSPQAPCSSLLRRDADWLRSPRLLLDMLLVAALPRRSMRPPLL
jgi:hypothetical protein